MLADQLRLGALLPPSFKRTVHKRKTWPWYRFSRRPRRSGRGTNSFSFAEKTDVASFPAHAFYEFLQTITALGKCPLNKIRRLPFLTVLALACSSVCWYQTTVSERASKTRDPYSTVNMWAL